MANPTAVTEISSFYFNRKLPAQPYYNIRHWLHSELQKKQQKVPIYYFAPLWATVMLIMCSPDILLSYPCESELATTCLSGIYGSYYNNI